MKREIGADKASALEWLAHHGFIERRDTATTATVPQEARTASPAAEGPPDDDRPPVGTAEGVPVNVKGYRYTDGDGNVIYEVIRQQFKLPDGSWALGKNGNAKKT